MSNAQDSSNPLRSVLDTLKDRLTSKPRPRARLRGASGVLAGDDYPELRDLGERSGPPLPVPEPCAGRLERLLEEGNLRALEPEQVRGVVGEILQGGLLEAFGQVMDQIRAALQSPGADDRRWGLGVVEAVLGQEEPGLLPYGTLPLLFDCMGHALAREEDAGLRNDALPIVASLLGMGAIQEDVPTVHARLAWLSRTAAGDGLAARILASRNLVLPMLTLYFRQGHQVLESRVLPFMRSLGEPGARTLVALLEEEGSRQHRNRILELLKRLGPLSLPALEEGLDEGSWQLVRNALNLVGELEEPQAFEHVAPCLAHGDARVVHAAVRALWKTGGARAEPYLLDLLAQEDGEYLPDVLEGLGHVGTAAAVPALERLAGSGDESRRIQALETLAKVKRPEAIPFLEAQLQRRGKIFRAAASMPIRLAAARALAAIGTKDACQVLAETLHDEPPGPDREALRAQMEGLAPWG